MAPPMAAEALGRSPFGLADLVDEVDWPDESVGATAGGRVDVGVVETAGGVRSPLAADGDCLDLCAALAPDLVLLVADAGLGTINAVRLSADAASRSADDASSCLNRFDAAMDLHRRNLEWLRQRDGRRV